MNKDQIIKKMEESLASMREALAKNEGSTLQTLVSGLKSAFDTVKNNVRQNETAQKVVSKSKKYLNEFEDSIKTGDRKLSASLLDKAQKILEDYKKKEKS